MWILILNILLIAGFSKGSDDCGPEDLECRSPYQFGYPQTEEEFTAMCVAEIADFECQMRYYEKCNDNPEILRRMKLSLDDLQRYCDKNSPRYAGIIEGLNCAQPVLKDFGPEECWNVTYDEDLMKINTDKVKKAELPVLPADEEDMKECAKTLTSFACEAAKLAQECGENTVEAYIEVMYARYDRRKCDSKVKEHLQEILRVLEVVEEAEEEMEEVIENKKK